MRTGWIIGVAAALMTAALTQFAQATQIEYVTPAQMGDESTLVVRGTVGSVRSFWNETRTKILTETTVRVDEAYKGSASGLVRIVQLGGVVGHMRMHVHGALSWRPDEEVLLFLDGADAGDYRVAGFSQGKFKIERDPATGEAFVNRSALEGVEVFGAPPGDGRVVGTGPVRVPLDEFVKQALGQR